MGNNTHSAKLGLARPLGVAVLVLPFVATSFTLFMLRLVLRTGMRVVREVEFRLFQAAYLIAEFFLNPAELELLNDYLDRVTAAEGGSDG